MTIAHFADINSTDFVRRVGDYGRLENVTPAKVDSIVAIVRAILNDEINRVPTKLGKRKCSGNYIGVNIYRDGTIVNYAETYGEFDFENPVTKHYVVFRTEVDAIVFHGVLSGILMLGLTPFQVGGGLHPSDVIETRQIPAVTENE